MDFGSFTNSGKMSGGAGGASGDINSTTNYSTNASAGMNNGGWTIGSGSAKVSATNGAALNPWMIGGLVAAALVALVIYKKK